MNDIKEHIKNRNTNFITTPLTEDEIKKLKFEGIEEVIFKRLTTTKFRTKALVPEQITAIKKAIHINVSKKQPLKLTHSFGAYKIWRISSYPYPDWAEFISLSWFFKFASYICSIYEPGVEYQFLSQDCCITMLDNYPKESLDKYRERFLQVFESFKPHLPKNLKITFTRLVPDLYSQEEYDKDLEETAENLRKTPYTSERLEQLLASFRFNTLLKGDQDLTSLSEEELNERYKKLTYYSDGILLTPKDVEFETGEDKILVFEIPLLPDVPNSIAIGSSAVSRTLHWAGTGIFEYNDGRFFDRVLSPKQYESIKSKLETEDVGTLVPGMPESVNIFNGRLDFLTKLN